MAWFGEHLNNITGKISDFTKDVILSENSQPHTFDTENVISQDTFGSLQRLCTEQESQINELLQQKQDMENNIVELDDEHQVIVNELLSQKRKLAVENKQLKAQISEKDEHIPDQTLVQNCTSLNSELSSKPPLSGEELSSKATELNILTVFQLVLSCLNHEDGMTEKHLILERFSDQLKTVCDDKSASKIDSYINYFNLIADNKQALLPVMNELTSVLNSYNCTPNNSNNNCVESHPGPVCEILSSEHSSISVQTDESSSSLVPEKIEIDVTSQHCQTNLEVPCDNVNSLCTDSISQTDRVLTSVSSLQTENVCHCDELRQQLEKTVAEMNDIKEELMQKEQSLQSQLSQQVGLTNSLNRNIAVTQELLAEKEEVILKQNQDIYLLRSDIEKLQQDLNDLNHQRNSNISQSDVAHSCNSAMQNNFPENGQLCMSVSDSDKLLLQQKLKALDLEKSQLLYVLNEKSQECCTLKGEVHRLTDLVAVEKQACLKLQQDNNNLMQVQTPNLDVDLTKEALQNLSRMVRDKEVEIEALKQKNDSLTSVVQQSVTGAEQVQSLIEQNEQLIKNAAHFEMEKAKIVASYNTKDQECQQLQTEIEQLQLMSLPLNEKLESLQQRHDYISRQYEDKKKCLINVENDMLVLKQEVADTKQKESEIQTKFNELNQRVNSDTLVTITKEEFASFTMKIVNLKASAKEKNDLIHEKDCLIHELSQASKTLKLDVEQANDKIANLHKTINEQSVRLCDNENAFKMVSSEKETLEKRLNDKLLELSLQKEMNEHLSMAVKEKEFSVKSLEEKITSLSSVICSSVDSPSSPADIDQILADSKEMYAKAQSFHRERDETLLALSQSQQEKQELKSEVQKLKAIEEHLKSELHRLRKHLLEIEESYTNEALKAETREKELRNRLAESERTVKVSNLAVLDASHQTNIQVASLQEQIVIIAAQRDSGLTQISSLEDKVQQYSASLSNLQLVLDQMQRGHEQKSKDKEKKWHNQLDNEKQKYFKLEEVINLKERELRESSQVLEAATRLSEKLDAKEELISHLKNELLKVDKKLKTATNEIDSMKCNSEGKVDRVVMKSLVLGYFSTPPNQKSEVLRLLARVLDFNQQEMTKAGIIVGKNSVTVEPRGLFSSIFSRLPSLGSSPQKAITEHDKDKNQDQQSFTMLFVKFLETESQPIQHLPLPAEEMARELTMKSKIHKRSSKNQLLVATPERSSLLMGVDSVFPTFSPMNAGESSMPTILQDILQ